MAIAGPEGGEFAHALGTSLGHIAGAFHCFTTLARRDQAAPSPCQLRQLASECDASLARGEVIEAYARVADAFLHDHWRSNGRPEHAGASDGASIRHYSLGASASEVVWKREQVELRQLHAGDSTPTEPPLLAVYGRINRPTILDLRDDCSLLRALARGRSVFVLDWGYPTSSDADLGLADHIDGYILPAVEHLRKQHDHRRVDLLGICQGGTLALCAAARNASVIRRLVTMMTPVDFQVEDDLLGKLLRALKPLPTSEFERNIPGWWIALAFNCLRPLSTSVIRAMDAVLILERADPSLMNRFIQIQRWLMDTPDHPARLFHEFVELFYRANALVEGKLVVAGQPLRLLDVTCPVLNLVASRDHIVPPASSRALARFVPRDRYTCIERETGHIGLMIGRQGGNATAPIIDRWLRGGGSGSEEIGSGV